MGAVVTMRPDLVSAVLMGVPFVDIVTTMLDASIPLTTIEVRLNCALARWASPARSSAVGGVGEQSVTCGGPTALLQQPLDDCAVSSR